ncbi:MAG TPA: hypothetical protein PKD72_12095 [Gemmatales bacterium]|nr:hypothetical protein [Gemmatales bacterium]
MDEKAGRDQLQGKRNDVRKIEKELLWISSSIFTYPFSDVNYHEIVTWVAEKSGVAEYLRKEASTFMLEREIQKQLFAQLWDKLDAKQRMELLRKLDPNGSIKDKAAVAALSGAAVLGTLSATVLFTGFAFYTTMSITISTVAGFFGLTLPFAAYTGASSLVAFLTGPIGWTIMGLAGIAGLALAGRANEKKTAAFICQIHAFKVAALLASGTPEKEVFSD